jgi:hypothetical protein
MRAIFTLAPSVKNELQILEAFLDAYAIGFGNCPERAIVAFISDNAELGVNCSPEEARLLEYLLWRFRQATLVRSGTQGSALLAAKELVDGWDPE